MKKFVWIIIVVVIIVVVVVSVTGKKKTVEQAGAKKTPTAVAKIDNISIVLDEVGEIRPVKEVSVKSKLSGRISKMFVEEGEAIHVGDIIAEIEPDMAQAQTLSRIKSTLKTTEINLENAQKDYESSKELYDKSLISDEEWRDAQNTLKLAQISYDSALEQYKLVEEIGITETNMKVTAPVSGMIINKNVEEGEMVVSSESYSGGTVLITIADLSQMIILTDINEVDIGKISLGREAKITIDAFPDKKYKGKITHISPMATIANNNIRIFQVKISIEDNLVELRPGMSANVTIIGKTRNEVVTIPIQAIFQDDNGNDIVYIVKSDTLITPSIVKTGINDLQKVEILEGVAEGDTISLVEKYDPSQSDAKSGRRYRMH
ncbi:MAG: efflux RND transporter periplasmic adaptor subunit [Candidatus Cloacimonetes bacterium]|nr:efflux RND transporter periplasmic adaptor subunit [Candidatus Cloacimonadota bacterium]